MSDLKNATLEVLLFLSKNSKLGNLDPDVPKMIDVRYEGHLQKL